MSKNCNKKVINKAAILGAGVMGSSIAGLLAAAGIQVTLLDVVPRELTDDDKKKGLTEESKAFRNKLVNNAYKGMLNPKTGILLEKSHINNVRVGNMTDDMHLIGECDWIIEVVLEQLEVKQQVMKQVAKYRKPGSIVSSNTSGVPIRHIIEGFDDELKENFLGTHFFNPPRFMKLFELIPTEFTSEKVLETLSELGKEELGKTVILAKDTPNFIGNRIGVYGNILCMKLMEKYNYNIPTVDNLTGVVMGRPRSATFKTADLAGIDVLCNVANNVVKAVESKEEQEMYTPPVFVQGLVKAGALGNKTKQGFYKKVKENNKKVTLAFDVEAKDYLPIEGTKFETISAALKSSNKYAEMAYGNNEENKFVWEALKGVILYAASLIPEISDEYTRIDAAMVAGFNWEIGPFQIWDKLGVERSIERMKKEGDKIPAWVEERLQKGEKSFYEEGKNLSEYINVKSAEYPVIMENKDAKLKDIGDGVLCLEFVGKGNALSPLVIKMMEDAANELHKEEWKGLVIGNEGKNFSAGADLSVIGTLAEKKDLDGLNKEIANLQRANMSLRYAPKPVVAAPFGTTLGGGAEVVLHSAAAVPYAESYMGLVEAGVGLVPAGGGCTQMLRRVMENANDKSKMALLNSVKKIWKQIAMGTVTSSAFDAQKKGFLNKDTKVSFNKDALISKAKALVLEMSEKGYHPPAKAKFKVLGDYGRSSILYDLELMEKGKFISEHDGLIARKVAFILTGGDLPEGVEVDEQYILDLEREAFVQLTGEKKTQERIYNMLTTGKVLRN